MKIPLPVGHWWPTLARDRAEKRAKKLGLRPPGIRDLVRELGLAGVDVDEDTIGRCLRGEIVTWEVALPLSAILEIPPPAAIAATPEQAIAMDSSDELAVMLGKLQKLRDV